MKTVIAFAFLLLAGTVSAQSLRDALYSGKLKSDSGTVIRKGEDLSTKMDTTTRVVPPPVVAKEEVVLTPSEIVVARLADSAKNGATITDSSKRAVIAEVTAGAAKDNNKIWKDYIDSLQTTIQTEVIPNKKVKSGTYSLLIDYEIDLDGTINVKNVSASPESSFLEQQVRERITLSSPVLTPLLNQYGKPRKAARKQTITFNK